MAYGQNHYLEIGQIQKVTAQGKSQFYNFFPQISFRSKQLLLNGSHINLHASEKFPQIQTL